MFFKMNTEEKISLAFTKLMEWTNYDEEESIKLLYNFEYIAKLVKQMKSMGMV